MIRDLLALKRGCPTCVAAWNIIATLSVFAVAVSFGVLAWHKRGQE